MYFSSKAITKKDLINSYKQTIEIYKSSINHWIKSNDKSAELRIKNITLSIEKLKQYIKELK